jgi:hypothetical protein
MRWLLARFKLQQFFEGYQRALRFSRSPRIRKLHPPAVWSGMRNARRVAGAITFPRAHFGYRIGRQWMTPQRPGAGSL